MAGREYRSLAESGTSSNALRAPRGLAHDEEGGSEWTAAGVCCDPSRARRVAEPRRVAGHRVRGMRDAGLQHPAQSEVAGYCVECRKRHTNAAEGAEVRAA